MFRITIKLGLVIVFNNVCILINTFLVLNFENGNPQVEVLTYPS